ncbi:DsbA family protein [Rhodobacteraceae bacterium HSP-20]|uniref:DsbA family protein n=1 Tax=Paragemmobacter amnigenus TaxID=2852097 RepID=A0ABS6J8Q0_9RHOB|nr:DsbA family protein [Rhodobacter amnigenus]MBU9698847.1 DsbA family protein [Rhodobacter amnigenus]MBV4390074.1 DsbA family protein [Rhodobacter amnigenus]
MTLDLTRRGLIALAGTAGTLMLLPRASLAQELTPEAVLRDPDAPVLGNPEGDVTVVEFFDYQCPFCKGMHPMLTDVVTRDGNLRLVMKDWPIFGAPSVYASQLVLGAHGLGLYDATHAALMKTEGRLSEAQIDKALAPVVDPARAMASYKADRGRWDELLQRNDAQATALGFQGTPGVAVDTTLFAGAIDQTTLEQAIATARAG